MNLMIIIQFVPAFIIIIVLCRLLGRFMQVIGQPRVIGEMIAGVMLGPSLMGHASPQLSTMLFSEEVKQLLQALSSAGLGIYMFLVGLEIDRQLMNRKICPSAHCSRSSASSPPSYWALQQARCMSKTLRLPVSLLIYLCCTWPLHCPLPPFLC